MFVLFSKEVDSRNRIFKPRNSFTSISRYVDLTQILQSTAKSFQPRKWDEFVENCRHFSNFLHTLFHSLYVFHAFISFFPIYFFVSLSEKKVVPLLAFKAVQRTIMRFFIQNFIFTSLLVGFFSIFLSY